MQRLFDQGVGRLSPRLRRIVQKLAVDAPALARRTCAALHGGISDYRSMNDASSAQDVYHSVEMNVQLWYHALLTGHPPTAEEIEPIAVFARHRVHQGVSLPGYLQAFRVGSRLFWSTLLDAVGDDPTLGRELLRKVSPYILYHFDLIGHTVALAYTAEQNQRIRWRDRLRHDLYNVIYNQPGDERGFREHTAALGLDATAPHVALALKLEDSLAPRLHQESEIGPLLDAISRSCGIDREGFLRMPRHGHLLVWLPLPGREPAIHGDRVLAEQAAKILKPRSGAELLGIGLPDSGAHGWRRSADQALKAIELGTRLQPERALHRYLDVAFDDLLSGSDGIAGHLEHFMDRLALEPELLQTLHAYFRHRQHRKAAAGALKIHPNTLSYRLGRIESLLGAELNDTAWVALLHSALRQRQLSQPARKRS